MACLVAVFRQLFDLKADAQCLAEDHDGDDIELAVRDQVDAMNREVFPATAVRQRTPLKTSAHYLW